MAARSNRFAIASPIENRPASQRDRNFEYRRIYTASSSRWLVDLQECGEAFADFIEQLNWSHVSYFDVSFLPGETAHLVYQNDAGNSVPTWNGNFKWVTSRPARNWADDTKTRSHIVLARRQHDRWTMTALFVAQAGIEIDPHKIAGIRAITGS